jgi:hypothetical protein
MANDHSHYMNPEKHDQDTAPPLSLSYEEVTCVTIKLLSLVKASLSPY